MPSTRQTRRDLSQVATLVADRSADATRLLPLLKGPAFGARRPASDLLATVLKPPVGVPVSDKFGQTMVGVGRWLGERLPPAAAPRGPQRQPAASMPAPAVHAIDPLRDTLDFVVASPAQRSLPAHAAPREPRGGPLPGPGAGSAHVASQVKEPSLMPSAHAANQVKDQVDAPSTTPPAGVGLFRKAAVDARRADGVEVDFMTGVQGKSWSILLVLLSLIALSFLGAALASVEVTAEAAGVLRAPNGLRPVASVLAGPITEVLVRGGDAVEPGQVVARLESTELRASLTNRLRELEIVREDVTLAAQHDRKLEAQSTSAMQRRRAAIQARVDVNAERLKQRRTQNASLDALVQEGGASRAEGLVARESVQETAEVVSALGNDLALLDLEIADRARQWQERESARRTQLSRAEANVDEAKSLLAATEIRAPASGRIESLLVAPGAVVPAGGVLGNIVPNGTPRSIVGFVASREIAFVRPGAAASIEVQSLPVSEFGLGKAKVTRVSTDVATPAEVLSLLGEAPVGSVVRVELELIESESSARMDALLRSGERVKIRLHRRELRLITLLFDFVRRWLQ